ncbi:MAG: Zn-dependent hydrolase of the beta-lactamase fold-like protein [Candidatus Magasanikbacteria bacterium GW2011_GWA2_46_17]|uniref:Zn-dependent hydrolase of the beta-lactamase fold-like protein n=1 Tax=Candidatus Magasanikbacteria bacterium GW2011_GWA2_46_17 TaxID=1619042 RepID=A0A0G1P3U0_9BACT|nr:MAG: Zn-dependent hydrolase of the beta-lactamase fold-like protein [Candidatus Magasanikbacteria bacterium GW2011_GWA2_46_17]HBF67182.1 hypothetical protein [Candidatus Magasanikbacteria bacterium]
MNIQWFGNSCFRIQTKHHGEPVDMVIDSYKPANGDFPRNLSTNIALFTHGADGTVTLSDEPMVIETPGEYETKGIFIYAYPVASGLIFYFESEQVTCAHLGYVNKELTDKELELVGEADILMVPVGGGDAADASTAVKIVTQIEPRIVIPMCYHSAAGETWDKLEKFSKALGLPGVTPDKKFKVTKKELPEEETKLVIIERS